MPKRPSTVLPAAVAPRRTNAVRLRRALAVCLVAGAFWQVSAIFSTPVFAKSESAIGKVVFIRGEAQAITPEGQARNLSLNQNIFLRETLETKNGKLKILFEDKTLLSLEENSKVLLTEYIYKKSNGNRKSVFDIIQGRIRSVVEGLSDATPSDIQFRTPTAVAGVRGTELGIIVTRLTTTIACFDGLLAVFSKNFPDDVMMIPEGQYVVVTEGPLPFSKLLKFSNIKGKFSYRYLEYPLVANPSQNRFFEEKEHRRIFRGAGGNIQTAGPDIPLILPGGSRETLSLDTPLETPVASPSAPPPVPAPAAAEPAPTTAPTPDPVPTPVITPVPIPDPVLPPAAPTDGPVTVPFNFPREG